MDAKGIIIRRERDSNWNFDYEAYVWVMSDDGAAIQCVEALLTMKKTSDLTRAKHFWWVIFFHSVQH